MFIVNFIIGLMIVAAGVAGLRFNYQLVNLFGRNNIFERKLGPGTTYPVFKLLSLLAIVGGFLVTLSLHDNVMNFLLGPIIDAL